MDQLVWTIKPPKLKGWYWMRGKNSEGILEVDDALIRKAESHFGEYISNQRDDRIEWAGPIPRPIEVTA